MPDGASLHRRHFYAGGFDRLMKEVVTLGSGLIFDQGQRPWCAYIARRLEILGRPLRRFKPARETAPVMI